MAKKLAKEADEERGAEIQRMEKEKFLKEKKEMEERLKRDKEERFGKKIEDIKVDVKKPNEIMNDAIKSMKKIHNCLKEPNTMKNTLELIKKCITNVKSDPSNEKFRVLKCDNKTVDNKIMKVTGG